MQNKIFSSIKFIFGYPLSIIAFLFVIKLILYNFNDLNNISFPNIIIVFISLIIFLLYFFQRVNLWRKIISVKSVAQEPFLKTAYLWETAEIRRFIPGNIWSIATRVNSFSKNELKKSTAFYLYFFETFYISIADIILSLFSISIILGVYKHFYLLFVALLIFAFILTIGTFFVLLRYKNNNKIQALIKVFEGFGIKKNLHLLLNSIISEALFGLGSYFSIIALFHLPVSNFLEIISFLIFARFIGYISFITPMGLGIREGIITAGFLKYLSLSSAALAAIFARIVLIIAEIIFLVLVIILNKFKETTTKIETFVFKNKYGLLITALIITYILYFTFASFARYNNFYTGRFDLGNMDQTVWNTLHGKFFSLTNPDGTQIVSRLSYHADFLLILLAPFYLIWQDPRMLLLIQSIVIALGAIFIYKISKDKFNNQLLAFIFSLSYLFYPALQDSNLYDFHSDSLIPTFFLGSFYFMKKKKYFCMIIFLILAGLCKEEIWMMITLWGIYLIFFEKKKILGIIISSVSAFLLFFIFLVAIPHFHDGYHFAFSYYSQFGKTPSQIIKTMLLDPKKTFSTLFAPDRLKYLSELFMPLSYFSLFSPFYLIIAGPDFLINLLSTKPELHQIYYQYTGGITAFVFISFIFGSYFLHKKLKFVTQNFLIFYVFIFTMIGSYFLGPLPFDKNPNLDMFDKPLKDADLISDFLNDIDQSYSIASSNNLGSHLSHRDKIFTIPIGLNKADIVAFLLNDKFASPSLPDQIKMAESLKKNKDYIEVIKLNDFVVFEKRNLYIAKKPPINSAKIFPLSIPTLEERDYEIEKLSKITKKYIYKQYSIYFSSFSSDGTSTNIVYFTPNKNTHSPVILMPFYPIFTGTEKSEISLYLKAADFFVKNNYIPIIIEPNTNNSSLSNSLEMPIETLTFLSSVSDLKNADTKNIFLWGEGIGSQTVLSVLEANSVDKNEDYKILGAAVWSPIINIKQSFDFLNTNNFNAPNAYTQFYNQINTFKNKDLLWKAVSPRYYLSDLKIPVNITSFSQSILDYQWAIELYNDLKSLNREAYINLDTQKIDPAINSSSSIIYYLKKDLSFFKSKIKN